MLRRLTTRQLLIALGVLVALTILFFGLGILQDALFRFNGFLEIYILEYPVLGPILFILLAALSVMLGPLTSTPLIPSAVLLLGPERVFVYLLTGWLLGNTMAYLIGYHFGYPLVKKLLKKEKLEKWEKVITKHVTFPVALIFRIATPSETGYLFGMIRYGFPRYLLLTFLAELPLALVVVYGGQALVETSWWQLGILGATWFVVLALAIFFLKGKIKKASK